MADYEVLVETINPCGGGRYAQKDFIEVSTDDPRAYVVQNGQYPIIDEAKNAQGDVVITTGDEAGNKIRYTFSE